ARRCESCAPGWTRPGSRSRPSGTARGGLERSLGPALAALLAALGDGLLGGVERLAGELPDLSGGLARAAAAPAEDLLAAALGMPRQARDEKGQDEDEYAEGCDAGDDHAEDLPGNACSQH